MTFKEFAIITDAIKTYYPKDNMFPTEQAMGLWYDALKDLDYKMAEMQIKKHISTSKYPPTIADIRECLNDFAEEKVLDTSQAWEVVLKALETTDENGNASKHFLELPEYIQRAVGGKIQFLEMANEPRIRGMEKANFMKVYPKIAEEERKNRMLQPEIRKAIGGTVQQIGEKESKELIGDERKNL